MRRLTTCAVVLLGAMGLPEGASAHSLVRPAGALVSYVSADATSLNTLRVREGDGRIEFYDPTVDGGMDPGSCTPGEVAGGFIIEVFCPASAVTRVRIDLGEREDSAKTSLPIATTLLGGPGADDLTAGIAADELSGGDGDDSLTGREGDDAMDGGLGVDTLEGGSGADQIQSRDGLVDTIRCGGDADIVYADTVDDIAADCETVNRVFVAPPSGSDGDEPGRPDLNVGTDKVQRLGSARRVRVYATSSEPGTISASGFIDIAGLSLPVKIDPSPIAIGGAGVELAYTLGKARWRRARRALRHGREVAVRLGVVATDVAGNTRRQDAPRIRVIPSRWSAAAGRAAAVRAPRHPTPGDMDGDEIKDVVDNCPTAKNGSQIDTDNDGQGDACDEDDDDDGVLDGGDNCRIDHNPDQADTDGDGYGDACPPVDSDQDGVINDDDNCDFDANPDQDDLDGDDKGDVCDRDLDGDRFDNDFDNCPTVYNLEPTDIDGDGLINDQVDRDGDGIGTACDPDEPVIEPPPDPDETPPDVTLEVPGNESLAQLEAGMIVRIGCSEACTATTDVVVNRRIANQLGLGHRRVLASGTTRLDGEGMTYAFVRAKARHLTGNGDLGSFHAKLKTRVTDESGNARELTRRFSLRR